MNAFEREHHAAVAKTKGAKFPYGECECRNGCGCAKVAGPAAFTVVRDGTTIKVCTRCDFDSDRETRKTLPSPSDDLSVYVDFDALGAFCLFPLDEDAP